MKFFQTLVIALVVLLYPAALLAGDGKPGKQKSIQEQIAAYISYPEVLKQVKAGVVSLSFKLTCDNRITAVEAHSGIAELDTFLEQSLSGKMLVSAMDSPSGKYRIRIRFRQE
jgi:hypothetical protein